MEKDTQDLIVALLCGGVFALGGVIRWACDRIEEEVQYKNTQYTLKIGSSIEYRIGWETTPERSLSLHGGILLASIQKMMSDDPFLALALYDIRDQITIVEYSEPKYRPPKYQHPHHRAFIDAVAWFVCDYIRQHNQKS